MLLWRPGVARGRASERVRGPSWASINISYYALLIIITVCFIQYNNYTYNYIKGII